MFPTLHDFKYNSLIYKQFMLFDPTFILHPSYMLCCLVLKKVDPQHGSNNE
jgi:hypothetical protein